MTASTAERLDELEEHARRAEERLRRLEAAQAPRRVTLPPPLPPPPAPSRPPATAPSSGRSTPPAGAKRSRDAAPAPPRPSLEELLGGRVLAWVGGAAVLVGLVLLFALGVSSGWIGEAERCALAAAGCLVLLAAGVRLHERAGRTEAARAAAATALGGLFLTLTVAGSHYELMPAAVAITLAACVGALGVALAIRWASPVIAALGLVGALLAPALAGVAGEPAGLAFLAVAVAAAVAVLVWQRWRWLSVCVAVVVTPQWLLWLSEDRSAAAIVVVLGLFGALQAVAAVGTALRAPREALTGLPAVLLAVNALVLGVAGWFALVDEGSRPVALAWLAGLAVAHVALGLAARRTPRLSVDLGLLCLALGVLLVDVGFALATDGLVRALGWAAGVVAFAWLARLAGPRRGDAAAAASGLGLHVALAVLAGAQGVDTATLLEGGGPTLTAAATLAALAGACLVSARLAPAHRLALDVTGLAAAALLAALTLDGVALTAVWALEAAALCTLGARQADRTASIAGLVHLVAAAVWCLADQASPTGLVDGVPDLTAAALGLGAVLAATARLAVLAEREDRPLLLGALALGALHLASLAVVDLGGPGVREGQLRLSGLWALAGVGALVAGLRRDVAAVRTAALALLGVTVAKVFVYDLATQEPAYRVASFLGLGVLLLGAAFAYQRLRPEAPGDLRGRPPALR